MSLLPTTNSGYLEIILGPMFSGKTSRLIEIYKKCEITNIPCIMINHTSDNRFTKNQQLISHDGKNVPCILLNNIYDSLNELNYIDIDNNICKDTTSLASKSINFAKVILINEGQFFDDIKESVLLLTEKFNKIVYVCGLDGDFKRNQFGKILNLIPYSDNIIKLPSLCKLCQDGTHAIFSHRINKSICQKLVGGKDEYIPLCRKCYLENNLTINVPYVTKNPCSSSAPRANDNQTRWV